MRNDAILKVKKIQKREVSPEAFQLVEVKALSVHEVIMHKWVRAMRVVDEISMVKK